MVVGTPARSTPRPCRMRRTSRASPGPASPPPRLSNAAGFRVQGPGFRVQGAGCRVQGSGCRVQSWVSNQPPTRSHRASLSRANFSRLPGSSFTSASPVERRRVTDHPNCPSIHLSTFQEPVLLYICLSTHLPTYLSTDPLAGSTPRPCRKQRTSRAALGPASPQPRLSNNS